MTGLDPDVASLLAPVAGYLLAAGAALGLGRRGRGGRALPSLLLMLAAAAGMLVATTTLLGGTQVVVAGWSVGPAAQVSLRLDALGAFFLLVISLPALPIALYGLDYLSAAHGDQRQPGRAGIDAAVAVFLAAMTLLVMADSVFTFLVAWEVMSLASFFLVMGDGRQRESRRAAFIYIVMTHVGTALLLMAFLGLFRHAGALDFAAFRAAAGGLSGWERNGVFLLALIGFGTKAGLIPLHVWLPRAHPAAPSHVSALMSGVMVKTAIYGLLRVIWEFAAPAPAWWGALLLGAGAVSAVLGILYSLMERDIKRVLAYSTIEHVGLIVMGLGTATLLAAGVHREAAALALVAALVHLLNHSLFKGLAFLGAGAVQTATGTRDLERLGGLIRVMPQTAALMLVAAAALSALPPLNGFVGEWLLLRSLLQFSGQGGLPATGAALAVAALGLTAALALAGFVRLFGVGFLAQPRSDGARTAREVSASMRAAMGLLAAGCIVLGLMPGMAFRLLRPVTGALVGASAQTGIASGPLLAAQPATGGYAPLALAGALLLIGIVPWLFARLAAGPSRTRVSPTWVCGVDLEPRMQYSATSFAKPIRLIFRAILRPERVVRLERAGRTPFVTAVAYYEGIRPIYERYLYRRVSELVVGVSQRVRLLQSGSIRTYLAYVFVTLLVVLMLAR